MKGLFLNTVQLVVATGVIGGLGGVIGYHICERQTVRMLMKFQTDVVKGIKDYKYTPKRSRSEYEEEA